MNMSDNIDMKRLLVMVGDGFSDSEITQAKILLERAFQNWKNVTVLITNKELKAIKVDTNAWDKLEKELDE